MRRAVLAVLVLAGITSAVTNPVLIKYPKYIQGQASSGTPGTGTPFAVLIGVRSDTAGPFQYKPRLQFITGQTHHAFWIDSTGGGTLNNSWQMDAAAWASCPVCTVRNTVDTAKVWTEVKCLAPTVPQMETLKLTVRRPGGSNIYQMATDSILAMNMTTSGTGGWLAGHVSATSSGPLLQNHVVLAYDDGIIVGSCITEDNRIIEGYPADPGYFLMAVRAGSIDSISVYGRTSYATPSAHYTTIAPPWTVVPGDTTWVDAPPTGPTIEALSRSPEYPLAIESVLVSARIFETGSSVDSARLLYAANDTSVWVRAAQDSIRSTDSTYFFHIPAQDTGARVYWSLRAWSAGGASRTATASYAVPLSHTIQEIQYVDTLVGNTTPDSGKYVHTLGVVTGIVTQNRFYVGDPGGGPWSGLHVYRSGAVTDSVRAGELLSVLGNITEYHGLSQFDQPVRLIHHADSVMFDTTTITVGQAHQEAFEGVLVRFDTIDVLDSTGTFNAGRTYRMANYHYTDTIDIYVMANSQFAGTAIPSDWATLVCNISDYDGAELVPRVPSDIFPFVPDVAATALLSPDTVSPGANYTPVVEIRNLSTVGTARNFVAGFKIGGVYNVQQAVTDLAPGAADTLTFDPWTATPGVYSTRAYTGLALDPVPGNDTLRGSLMVVGGGAAGAWTPLSRIPDAPSGRQNKDGSWMVEVDDQFYVSKGYKTADLYRYDPAKDSWYNQPGMPRGIENKLPYKGSCAAVGDGGLIYVVKGNNTPAFYSFNPADTTWTQLADVPLGLSNKKVKGGTDLVYYKPHGRPDSTWLYLLKGYKTEFYRYHIQSGTWETLPDAPAGVKPKWDRGSWLALDQNPGQDRYKILAHKAKYLEMHRYDIPTNAWENVVLKPMPLLSSYTGKTRKTKEGCAALVGDVVYTFKAANTQEFWQYTVERDSWAELETIPSFGPAMRKKRVKAGCDLLGYNGLVYALKGNKSSELWYYNPLAAKAQAAPAAPARDGIAAEPAGAARTTLGLPAVVTGRSVGVRFSLPAAAPADLRLYSADGRLVLERRLTAVRSGAVELDVAGLPAGVYVVSLRSGTADLSRRFALVR
ncbi:MAG: hypothetical protein R6X13_03495 [bacterium]